MNILIKLIDGFSIAEKRSSLYYLGRYIKQAEIFVNYEKDIFEDGINSLPSDAVKSLTIKMIVSIEQTSKKKAAEFDDDEYQYWMDQITEVEETLDPIPNEEQVKSAKEQITLFITPNNKTQI